MTDQDFFNQNIKILEEKQPDLAALVKNTPCNHWQFCLTEKGEQNLKKTEKGRDKYYHSMKGAIDEIKEWIARSSVFSLNYVVFYGVGLGHIYEAATEWLWLGPNRYLVILEDDLEVIHRLLETEMGGKILRDDHVQLRYFRSYEEDHELMQDILWSFVSIPYDAINIVFGAAPSYQQEKQEKIKEMDGYFRGHLENIARSREGMTPTLGVLNNFFYNLRSLPYAYNAHRLKNKFKNIPAIVCGGGPSIDQQIDVLREFENKAFIFAVGAGSNVLSHYQLLPHCNFGIDPNVIHYARILTQLTFEIPYAYSHRIHYEGIRAIHAPKVYFPKRKADPPGWFDIQLGLEKTYAMDVEKSAVSVGNFSLNSIAVLGCNPIILVGFDLSHSHQKTYSRGVINHPLISKKKDFSALIDPKYVIHTELDEAVTTVQFIREKQWFEEFAKGNSDIRLINASIGGVPIQGYENLSLEEVKKEIKHTSLDLRGMFHSEIFQGEIPQATPEVIEQLIEKWGEIMKKAEESCDQINQELIKDPSGAIPSEHAQSLIKEFEKSLGYQYWLKTSDWLARFVLEAKKEIWGQQITNEILYMLYSFLKIKAYSATEAINQVKPKLRKTSDRQWPCYPPQQGIAEEYMIEEKLTQPKESEPQYRYFPSGQLQSVQYYKGGQLHGPSVYYSEYGRVIAHSYFIEGKKEGHSFLYYQSGAIYAIESYIEGKRDGKQKYFYEDGAKRTLIEYDHGTLHGDLWEYYPEGNLKREMHFHHGQRKGYERLWEENTTLRLQMKWDEDKPVEIGRLWREDGTLELEARYEKDNAAPLVRHYEKEDALLEKIEEITDNSYQLKLKMEEALARLGNIDWDKMSSILKEEAGKELKEATEKLHDIEKRLKNGKQEPL